MSVETGKDIDINMYKPPKKGRFKMTKRYCGNFKKNCKEDEESKAVE